MPPDLDSRLEQARSASVDEIKALAHDSDEQILSALLENPKFGEVHAELLLDRLDLSANLVSAIAGKTKWLAFEGVRLRLAKHPRTPKRVALAAIRRLFLFNLVRLSLAPAAPADIRRLAEETILTRIPRLPLGEKLALARRGSARVAGEILAEGHPQALRLALGNVFLTESQILRVLAGNAVAERVILAIAGHPKWSGQSSVRVALVRNAAAPEDFVRNALNGITLRDLIMLSDLQELSPVRRKAIADELQRRAGNR